MTNFPILTLKSRDRDLDLKSKNPALGDCCRCTIIICTILVDSIRTVGGDRRDRKVEKSTKVPLAVKVLVGEKNFSFNLRFILDALPNKKNGDYLRPF